MGTRGFASVPSVLSNWSAVKHLQHQQAHLYEDIFNLLGATTTIVNLGALETAPSATTFTTRVAASGLAQTATWATAPSLLATPFSQSERPTYTTAGLHGPAGIPGIVLAGASAEYLSVPDDAYWTTAAGSNFSVIANCIVNNTATSKTLMAKYTANLEEWQFGIMSDEVVRLVLVDTTAGVSVRRDTDAAITTGVPHCIIVTYGGGAGATAMDSAVVYVDGASVASTATNNASFVTMRNNTGLVTFGATDSATPGSFYNGSIFGGPLGLTFVQTQLTANQVLRYNWLFRGALGLD